MCLRWGLAHILCVSGGSAVRGLLSLDAYVEWSEAELGEQLFLPHFYTPDSLSQYKTIPRPTSKHPLYHYNNLSLQSSSIFFLSSHASQLTHHRLSGHTPPTLSPLFGPLLFVLGPAALPFMSPISNIFVPPAQWGTSFSHLFAGKMHQVTSRLVRLADLEVPFL